jgi:hypothetical protein
MALLSTRWLAWRERDELRGARAALVQERIVRATYKASALARKMLTAGQSIDDVVAALGSQYTIEEITAGLRRLKDSANRARKNNHIGMPHGYYVKPVDIPELVIADRDRRATLVPRDLTAKLLGDPLPTLSAAELPRQAGPSITCDPLDGLICPGLRPR